MKTSGKNGRRVVILATIGLVFCARGAWADSLPDPLKLRAACAAPQPAGDPADLVFVTPEKVVAEADALFRRSVAATVVIEIDRGETPDCGAMHVNGTGTAVSDDGLVLTAYHVINGAKAIRAVFRAVDADGHLVLTTRIRPAKVVAVSRAKDVALLRLESDGQSFPHMAIECRWQAGQRTPLWHFGQRSGSSFGRVTFRTTSSVGIDGVYETDAPAQLGDSGGPFVRSTGSLVGILLSISGGAKSYYMPAADAIVALEKGDVAK